MGGSSAQVGSLIASRNSCRYVTPATGCKRETDAHFAAAIPLTGFVVDRAALVFSGSLKT